MGMSADDMMRDRLPETTPADTPAAPKTPAPAAPGGDTRTFAGGKYKTPEELETAYTSLERKMGEQADELGRLRSLVMAPGPAAPSVDPYAAPYQPPYVPPGTPVQPGYPPVDYGGEGQWVSREQAAQIAREEAARVSNENARAAAQAQHLSATQQWYRDEFFRQHPDLKDEELLVRGVTTEVIQRYTHLPADRFQVMIPSILSEVAAKTRERITHYKTMGRTEAERAAATQAAGQVPGQQGPVAPPGQPQAPTMDELRAEGIREEQEAYHRTRRPPSR